MNKFKTDFFWSFLVFGVIAAIVWSTLAAEPKSAELLWVLIFLAPLKFSQFPPDPGAIYLFIPHLVIIALLVFFFAIARLGVLAGFAAAMVSCVLLPQFVVFGMPANSRYAMMQDAVKLAFPAEDIGERFVVVAGSSMDETEIWTLQHRTGLKIAWDPDPGNPDRKLLLRSPASGEACYEETVLKDYLRQLRWGGVNQCIVTEEIERPSDYLLFSVKGVGPNDVLDAELFKSIGSNHAFVVKLERKSGDASELLMRIFKRSDLGGFIPADPIPGRSKTSVASIFAASLGLLDVYDQPPDVPDGARIMAEAAKYLTHPVGSHDAYGAYYHGYNIRRAAIHKRSDASDDADSLDALKNEITMLRDELRSAGESEGEKAARWLDSLLGRLESPPRLLKVD